jgi:hypothetical protein
MSTSLGIATEGLLQEEGGGGSCVKVVARENITQKVSRSVEQRTATRAANGNSAARVSVQNSASQQTNQVAAARLKTAAVVVTTACPATATPTPDPPAGSGTLDTVSKVNGHIQPMYAGQVVCSVAGEWQPAASTLSRFEAVGMLVDEVLLAGAAGRAQTTGVITLTAPQWDLVQTNVGGLVPESDYYLHPAGKITHDPDLIGTAVLVRVGYAINNTQFSLDIEPPILL